jgi:hypothetical protein
LGGKNVWRILSSFIFWIGSLFLAVSCFLFILFAPLKTTFFGFFVSFSTLDNPLRIFLLLFLIGLLFKAASNQPFGLERRELGLVIFCLVLLVHISSPVMTSLDSRWSLPTAKSLVKEGNTDLDEYRSKIDPEDYRIKEIKGHLYSIFPVGASLLAAPIALITPEEVIDRSYMDVERLVSSLLIAISSLFVYFFSCSALKNQKVALMMVFLFAFCTSTWSTASRALWQHGPSIALLSFSVFIIVRARKKPLLIQYLSLPLAFSFVVRPTNLIPLIILSIWVLLSHRKHVIRYLLWSLTVLVPFFIYNHLVYHSLLSPYFFPSRLGTHTHFFEALAANLISPSRGLFFYSPVFLLAFIAFFQKTKGRRLERPDFFLAGIVLLHWIAISSFPHWWAGHSYGPRFFSDMIPFFLYFLIPVMEKVQRRESKKRPFLIILVLVLTAISFFVHFRGATSTEAFDWNSNPVDIDMKPERVWDWKDIQFLRGLR